LERGATRLGRVVDDLLLLSKVGDPNNPVLTSPVDLRRVVDGVLELGAVTADRRSIRLVVDATDPAPIAAGDADELDRLVGNLVGNAIKYSHPGSTVTISLRRETGQAVLAVTDEGIGIAEDEQPLLFTEFFRSADPTVHAEPGTGLGLAIVARIVERHGGRVDVVSTLGRGSTFTVWLPSW
jgi:signal transduction histidine kinase